MDEINNDVIFKIISYRVSKITKGVKNCQNSINSTDLVINPESTDYINKCIDHVAYIQPFLDIFKVELDKFQSKECDFNHIRESMLTNFPSDQINPILERL